MRQRAKVDSNQSEIVSVFRKLGYSVFCTHQVGSGFPDIVCGKNGINLLVEIKDGSLSPSRRKLTKDESAFHNLWLGNIVIIESVDDVLRLDAKIKNT